MLFSDAQLSSSGPHSSGWSDTCALVALQADAVSDSETSAMVVSASLSSQMAHLADGC